MSLRYFPLAGLMLCAMMIGWGASVYAQPVTHREIVFAFDSSGSMKFTDPAGDSIKAAEVFIRLMDRNDKLAVLSFAKGTKVIFPRTRLSGAKIKAKAVRSLKRLLRKGPYTNLEVALVDSLDQFSGLPELERALLLVTDGKIDLDLKADSQSTREKQSRKRILEDLTIECQSRGVAVYTIALGDGTDTDLLDGISRRTGGLSFKIDRANQGMGAFLKIFNQVESPQRAPVKNGRFHLDDSVREAVLVIENPDNPKTLLLESPSGGKFRWNRKTRQVLWRGKKAYGIATIRNPEKGDWVLSGVADRKINALLLTDLKLHTPMRNVSYFADEPIYIFARMGLEDEKGSGIEGKTNYLAELLDRGGEKVDSIPLFDDGSDSGACKEDAVDRWKGGYAMGKFPASHKSVVPGLYVVRINGSGGGVFREKSYSINVHQGEWIRLIEEKGEIIPEQPLVFDFEIKPEWTEALTLAKAGGLPPDIVYKSPIFLDVVDPGGVQRRISTAKVSENRRQFVYPSSPDAGKYKLTVRLNQDPKSLICLNHKKSYDFNAAFPLKKSSLAEIEKQDRLNIIEIVLFILILGLIALVVMTGLLLRRMRIYSIEGLLPPEIRQRLESLDARNKVLEGKLAALKPPDTEKANELTVEALKKKDEKKSSEEEPDKVESAKELEISDPEGRGGPDFRDINKVISRMESFAGDEGKASESEEEVDARVEDSPGDAEPSIGEGLDEMEMVGEEDAENDTPGKRLEDVIDLMGSDSKEEELESARDTTSLEDDTPVIDRSLKGGEEEEPERTEAPSGAGKDKPLDRQDLGEIIAKMERDADGGGEEESRSPEVMPEQPGGSDEVEMSDQGGIDDALAMAQADSVKDVESETEAQMESEQEVQVEDNDAGEKQDFLSVETGSNEISIETVDALVADMESIVGGEPSEDSGLSVQQRMVNELSDNIQSSRSMDEIFEFIDEEGKKARKAGKSNTSVEDGE